MADQRDRSDRPGGRRERPEYTVYRSRPRLLERLRGPRREPEFRGRGSLRDDPGRPSRTRTRRLTPGRVARYVLLTLAGWVVVSLALFLLSAQIEESRTAGATERTLDRAGPLPFLANTVLVLGSDARPKGTGEGGANVVGQPSRSDTMMLIRTGAGRSAKLSIPRDTVVNIPGRGRNKINAAYAIGGPSLAVSTVKDYLDIDINHLVEVNFDNFPDFVDSLGGVTVRTGRVCARLDGGDANGGTTLDLRPGDNHLDGRHALALARVRSNNCDPSENDLDRGRRQQEILTAIKRRLVGPTTFLRLPWVSWQAPKAIRTDMGGFSLLGLFAAIQTAGSPPPQVLLPDGVETTPGGGSGLTVSEEARRSAVRRFLSG